MLATAARAAFAARSSTSLRVASPLADACSTASAASRTTVRIVPSTGPEHRLVRRVRGAPQAGDHVGSRDRLERRERVGEAAEDLREDHAGVPAGTHQRTVPDRLADLLHGGAVGGQLVDDGFERERHVGAGVAVGHRVDVEAVQLFLVVAQHVAVGGDHAAQISRRE